MSLNFAAIAPHPPILIPEIGQDDLNKIAETAVAMRKLAHNFYEAEVDTLIIVSPHGLVYPDRFNISAMHKSFGTFAQFDAPNIALEYANNLDLVAKISEAAQKNGIEVLTYNNGGEFYELDYGVMVPLYYLRREQEAGLKVVVITYAELDRSAHFAMGQILGEVARRFPDRVGILASGDLSHQLIQKPETKKIDQKLIDDLKSNQIQNILYYDEEIVESWSECGYRSILILLGALDSIETKPEILSYEGPFGIGHLVANFKLPDNN